MSVIPFDTAKLARRLRETARLSPEQADGISTALAESATRDLITRRDLHDFEGTVRQEVEGLEHALRVELRRLHGQGHGQGHGHDPAPGAALEARLAAMERRLTLRLGGLVVVATALLLAATILL